MYEKNRKQETSLLFLKRLSNSSSSSFAHQHQHADDDPLPLKSGGRDSLIDLHSHGSINSICKDLLDEETAQIDRLLAGMGPSTSAATNNNSNMASTSSLDMLDSVFLDGLVRSCDDGNFDTPVLPPPAPAHVGSSNDGRSGISQNVPLSFSSTALLPKKDRPHLGLFQLSSIGTIEDPELLLEQEGSGPETQEVRARLQKDARLASTVQSPTLVRSSHKLYHCCTFFPALATNFRLN